MCRPPSPVAPPGQSLLAPVALVTVLILQLPQVQPRQLLQSATDCAPSNFTFRSGFDYPNNDLLLESLTTRARSTNQTIESLGSLCLADPECDSFAVYDNDRPFFYKFGPASTLTTGMTLRNGSTGMTGACSGIYLREYPVGCSGIPGYSYKRNRISIPLSSGCFNSPMDLTNLASRCTADSECFSIRYYGAQGLSRDTDTLYGCKVNQTATFGVSYGTVAAADTLCAGTYIKELYPPPPSTPPSTPALSPLDRPTAAITLSSPPPPDSLTPPISNPTDSVTPPLAPTGTNAPPPPSGSPGPSPDPTLFPPPPPSNATGGAGTASGIGSGMRVLPLSAPPPPPASDSGIKKSNLGVIIAAVVGSLAVVAAVVGGVWFWRRRAHSQPAGDSGVGDMPCPFPGVPDLKTWTGSSDPWKTPMLGDNNHTSDTLGYKPPADVEVVVRTTHNKGGPASGYDYTDGSSQVNTNTAASVSQIGTPTWGSRQVGAGSLAATGTNMQPVLPAYQPRGYAARHDIDTTMVLRDRKLQSITIDWATIQVYEDQCLGHGGFGAVYGGLWMDVTPVAVKMLHAERVNEEVLNALRQEAFIMCDITHPYVARVYGLVDDGQHHALIMSWYKHGSLSGLMRRDVYSDMDMLERVKIAHQVACGMRILHERKPNPIIHGDLKTSNLLIENDGSSVVISDFGLAACLRRGQSGHVVDSGAMTLTISPPEVLSNPTAPRTTAGDVYAFGITLLEIATGKPAYSGINREQLESMVLSGGRPAIPVSVPPEVASIIRDCWAQQPQDRPSFALVFAKLSTAMAQLQQQTTMTTTQTGWKLSDVSSTITTTNW